MNVIITKLAGTNMNIDLATPAGTIEWEQNQCPWNDAENTDVHKCTAKNTSICPHFCGIEYLDTVLCCYPHENPLKSSRTGSNVTVVSGVIEHAGKVLIGKQVDGEHPADLGGKWHFPGGVVETGESLEDALKREVKEETNLCVEIKQLLGQRIDIRVTARVFYFRCEPTTHNLCGHGL